MTEKEICSRVSETEKSSQPVKDQISRVGPCVTTCMNNGLMSMTGVDNTVTEECMIPALQEYDVVP